MKRLHAAAAGAALALFSTAAWSAAGDSWQGSSTGAGYYRPAPTSDATPLEIRSGVYTERRVDPVVAERPVYVERPVIVERTYLYEPAYAPRDYYVHRDHHDLTDRLNPSTGHHIGRGLFPDKGPSDFGS